MRDYFDTDMEVGATYLVPVETRDGIEMRLCLLKSCTIIDQDFYRFKFQYEKRDYFNDSKKVCFSITGDRTKKCVKLIPRSQIGSVANANKV